MLSHRARAVLAPDGHLALAAVLIPAAASAAPGPGVVRGSVPLRGMNVVLFAAKPGAQRPARLGSTRSGRGGAFALPYRRAGAGTVKYLLATRPGGGAEAGFPVPGSSYRLAAALGAGSVPSRATLNERTTVAAGYALAQFIDAGRVAGKDPGLSNAAAMTRNLVRTRSGALSPVLRTFPNGNSTSTLRSFDSLANLLAVCRAQSRALRQPPRARRRPRRRSRRRHLAATVNLARYPWHNSEALFKLSLRGRARFKPALRRAGNPTPGPWRCASKAASAGSTAPATSRSTPRAASGSATTTNTAANPPSRPASAASSSASPRAAATTPARRTKAAAPAASASGSPSTPTNTSGSATSASKARAAARRRRTTASPSTCRAARRSTAAAEDRPRAKRKERNRRDLQGRLGSRGHLLATGDDLRRQQQHLGRQLRQQQRHQDPERQTGPRGQLPGIAFRPPARLRLQPALRRHQRRRRQRLRRRQRQRHRGQDRPERRSARPLQRRRPAPAAGPRDRQPRQRLGRQLDLGGGAVRGRILPRERPTKAAP